MYYQYEPMASRSGKPRILALGLGNELLQDDGVGVHALRSFQQVISRSCLCVEIGTAILDAIPMLENADRILAFDAVEAEGKPGTVYLLNTADMMDECKHASIHEIGLLQVLLMLRRPPAEVVIVGAEPHKIDWGIGLSPALDLAVPLMVSTAQKVVSNWIKLKSDHEKINLASAVQDMKCGGRVYAE
jgi:hydrogenase maturation protease